MSFEGVMGEGVMSETRGAWNYRFVRRNVGDGSGRDLPRRPQAHYEADKDRPVGITGKPVSVTGVTPGEPSEAVDRMREALSKPVLKCDDF